MFLDVATKQPALPLHIRDVPGSFLDLEIDDSDWRFSSFSSVPPEQGRDVISTQLLSDPSVTNYPHTLRHQCSVKEYFGI